MKIIWHDRALFNIDNILGYVNRNAGNKVAVKLVKQIRDKANGLNNFPEKYQRENNFDKERNIRRVVIYSYKIVYEIKTDAIYILDIFHTSQSPDKLSTI